MKKFEDVTVTPPSRTTHELVDVRCFVCDDPAPQPNEHGNDSWDRGGWAHGGYDIDKIVIYHEAGSTYPHSGRDATITEYDCCPKCWVDVIKPFLDKLGKPDVYELVEGKRYEKR